LVIGLEILQLAIHVGKPCGAPGLGRTTKSGFGGVAAAGNDGVVAMVDEEAQFGAAGAPCDIREGRCAEAEASVQVANFVAETNFSEAVKP